MFQRRAGMKMDCMSFAPLRSKTKTGEALKLTENYSKMVSRSRGFEGSGRFERSGGI